MERIQYIKNVPNPAYRWWNGKPKYVQIAYYLKCDNGYVVAEKVSEA